MALRARLPKIPGLWSRIALQLALCAPYLLPHAAPGPKGELGPRPHNVVALRANQWRFAQGLDGLNDPREPRRLSSGSALTKYWGLVPEVGFSAIGIKSLICWRKKGGLSSPGNDAPRQQVLHPQQDSSSTAPTYPSQHQDAGNTRQHQPPVPRPPNAPCEIPPPPVVASAPAPTPAPTGGQLVPDADESSSKEEHSPLNDPGDTGSGSNLNEEHRQGNPQFFPRTVQHDDRQTPYQ
ncbi:MAG: hypothetical protein J3R72DRAFT_513739 [Linnemannia gamsii]|nr:MAG: hypothetical protein J3R72DRAFT_513739 [Linnemannia gamsii]